MTKADNRAAARAYREEKLRQISADIEAAGVKQDLEHLDRLRRYLVLGWKSGGQPDALISAIDDCAENLTGDRRALHAKSSSIGG